MRKSSLTRSGTYLKDIQLTLRYQNSPEQQEAVQSSGGPVHVPNKRGRYKVLQNLAVPICLIRADVAPIIQSLWLGFEGHPSDAATCV